MGQDGPDDLMDRPFGGIEKGDGDGVNESGQCHVPAGGLAPTVFGGTEGEAQVEGAGGRGDPGDGHHTGSRFPDIDEFSP